MPYGTAIAIGASELATATPAAVAATGAVGTSTKAAKEDHVHAGVTLADATPSAVGSAGAVGTSSKAAKEDHTHAGVQLAVSTPAPISGSAAIGSSPRAAKEDHAHALSITLPDPGPDTGAPVQDGGTIIGPAPAGFLGTSSFYSRRDHIHPVNVNDSVLPADTASTASAGTSNRYSRADHVHVAGAAALETATPLADGTGAVGTSTKAAHGDHVHPANVDATAPSSLATAAAAGSSAKYSRADHAHPAQPTGLGTLVHIDTYANGGANTTTWVVDNAGKQAVKVWRHRFYYDGTSGAEKIVGVRHYEIYNPVTGGLVEVGPEGIYTVTTPELGV